MDCSLSIVKLKQTHQFLEEFTQRLVESNRIYLELKLDYQRYRSRVASLEAEVTRLQHGLDQSSALSLVAQRTANEKDVVIAQLKEEIEQYEVQESRHARESADYEDCIEQLETELKYALSKSREGGNLAEENFRLRKTIERMDAEADELQTTMKIFSTGESGSSLAAITMGKTLGPQLLNHIDDQVQTKNKPSGTQTTTITMGKNYANLKKPKIMEVGAVRQGYKIADAASGDGENVPPHPPPKDIVSSRQPSLAQAYATVTVTKDSSDMNHSVSNEWITGLRAPIQLGLLNPSSSENDAQLSLVPSYTDLQRPLSPLSATGDESITSDGSCSDGWYPPANPYWDPRRYVTIDNEERYVFRQIMHERRLKLCPSSSSVAQSFNCTYRFSSDRDSISDAASCH